MGYQTTNMQIDRKIRTFMELCSRGSIADVFQMWALRQVGAGSRTEVKLVDFRNDDYEFSLVYDKDIEDQGFFDQYSIDVDPDFNVYFFIGEGGFDPGHVHKYSYETGLQVWETEFGRNYDGLTWWDDRVYVLNALDDDIGVLDADDGQLITTLNTPQNFDAGTTSQFRLEDETIYYCITPSSSVVLVPLNTATNNFLTAITLAFPSDRDVSATSAAQGSYRIDFEGNHYCIYRKDNDEGHAMIKWDSEFNTLWAIDIEDYSGSDYRIEVDLQRNVFYSTKTGQTSQLAKILTDSEGLNPQQVWKEDIHTSAGLSPNIYAIQAERADTGRVFTGHNVSGNVKSVRKSDGAALISHTEVAVNPTAMIILPGFLNKLGE